MLLRLTDRIPEKYRFLSFLVITSAIGVALILFAVHNASRELERLHLIDSLYNYASARLDSGRYAGDDQHRLLALSAPGYRVMLLREGQIVAADGNIGKDSANISPTRLEQSRLNDHGGYLEHGTGGLAWARLAVPGGRDELMIIHRHATGGLEPLLQVYTRRLLIPAGFYIWLMIWMGFILSHLTDRLSRQKREMEYMALHDSLSGLPNRNLLNDRLNRLLENAERRQGLFALAIIDLDGFKAVNDTLGHDAGDTLLREIARRLGDSVRGIDTVARVGGDEFVLLLDNLDEADSLDICQRVTDRITQPVAFRDTEVRVGASIGIAVFPEHGGDPESLLRNADHAMYSAKARGGGIRLCTAPTSATDTVSVDSGAVSA